jgi:drug/metabolite transporter (DMT)-like permease
MTTAVEATVLITTIPVFTLAVGLLWGREAWSARKGLGIAVAFGGVLVLVGGSALGFGSATFLGDAFIALNALFYSVYLVASRPLLARTPPLSVTAATFVVAALVMLPFGIAGWGQVQPGKPDALGLAAMAYIVLGPTVFTYFAVSYALVRIPASTVASFIYVQPLVGVLLGVLLLHEPLTSRVLLAAGLIVAGVALCTLRTVRLRRMVPAA